MKQTNPLRLGQLATSASLLTSTTPNPRRRSSERASNNPLFPSHTDVFELLRYIHKHENRVADWVRDLLQAEPADDSQPSASMGGKTDSRPIAAPAGGRRNKQFSGSIFLWSLILAGLLGLLQPKEAAAFDLFGGTTAFSDIVGAPQDHWRWTTTALTFKFDPSFDAMFPDPALKNQVRLAFTRWGQASATPHGATAHFDRTSVTRPFGDLRSIALHELGHVLGLQHPDEADTTGRNFQPAAQTCPTTYSAQPDTGNEVMQAIINPGWYRHILTWDELEAYCFNYGSAAISFTEVFGATPADIVISSYINADPNNWAQGGSSAGNWINPADHSKGVSMSAGSGFIQFNSHSGVRMGFLTHGINWDYLNTSGQPARSIQIRTHGTDNPNVPFHYDNFDWPHPFGTFTSVLVGSSAKDDLLHTWSNPGGGDVPAGEILHVGLELDVYDWTVVSAVVKDPLGIASPVGFVSFHDWNNEVFSAAVRGSAAKDTQELRRSPGGTNLASGFRLVTPDSATHITSLALADVTGMHLTLPQLNRSLVQSLSQSNRLQVVSEFSERDFQPSSDFFFVLQGSAQDLPPNIRSNKNYLLLNRPDLAGKELLVFALSSSPDAVVGTYALLGTNAVASVQVPGLSVTPLPGCRIQVCWPNPSDGYVLQSTTSLTPPIRWSDVSLPVTVANGLKCVTISNACQGAMFFRLVRAQLPTYSVLGSGITTSQFNLLAQRLHLPPSALVGGATVQFTDQTNFAKIPTEFVGISNATNEDSGSATLEKFRFDLVNQIQVLDDATAINLAQDALGNAGLRPPPPYNAWPEIGHAQFTAVSSNGASISDLPIDTQVHFKLGLGGLPLVGPGAKVAMAFDGARNVTHLAYALRSVQQGQFQPALSQQEADAQAMSLYQGTNGPSSVQLSSRLVYYAPPADLTSVRTLIPYFQYEGTLFTVGGSNEPVQLRRILIPAIVNPELVPAVKLTASVQGSFVFGQAFVNGGVPPYTYEWNSSSLTLSPSNTSYASYSVPAGKSNPLTETVTVLVTDANGTRTSASQTFDVFTTAGAPLAPESWTKTDAPNIGGITDVGTEWVGTSMGLSGSAANANGFVTRMALGGSSIRFNWGDYNAWERDFKDPAFGGTDTSWVDNADAVFYTGHASANSWAFPGSHDDGSLHYSEARYGQNDIEWLVIAACGPLQTGTSPTAWWQRWGPAFRRLHLLCGYQTVTSDNTIEGNHWANYMQTGWTVRQAWMQTGKDSQGASERVAVMGVFDTSGVSNWNDHFWGRGSVGPDITSIGGYWMVSSPCD